MIVVFELIEMKIIGVKDARFAIRDLHGFGREPGCAEHSQIEQGNLFAGAALLRPDSSACLVSPMLCCFSSDSLFLRE